MSTNYHDTLFGDFLSMHMDWTLPWGPYLTRQLRRVMGLTPLQILYAQAIVSHQRPMKGGGISLCTASDDTLADETGADSARQIRRIRGDFLKNGWVTEADRGIDIRPLFRILTDAIRKATIESARVAESSAR